MLFRNMYTYRDNIYSFVVFIAVDKHDARCNQSVVSPLRLSSAPYLLFVISIYEER